MDGLAGDVLASHASNALELMRFTPPGWSVEPSFFTLEGNPVAHGSAIWEVRDLAAARDRLRGLGGLRPGEPIEIDITVSRYELVRGRPELPPGAIVLEAGPIDDLDRVPVATVRLEGAELRAETMSEERLERAIEMVGQDFGDLAELADREVVPIEQRLEERRKAPLPFPQAGSAFKHRPPRISCPRQSSVAGGRELVLEPKVFPYPGDLGECPTIAARPLGAVSIPRTNR